MRKSIRVRLYQALVSATLLVIMGGCGVGSGGSRGATVSSRVAIIPPQGFPPLQACFT
jgi:hypothetical protein